MNLLNKLFDFFKNTTISQYLENRLSITNRKRIFIYLILLQFQMNISFIIVVLI